MTNLIEAQPLFDAPFLNSEGLARDIGNLMVLAPHPDDESLGCGGLIASLRQSGKTVHIIFMTSGSASHPNSKEYPPNRLAEIREKEAEKACEVLGIEKENIQFRRLGDSKMHALRKEEIENIGKELAEIFSSGEFSSLALPWRRDPHSDHIATNRIGESILNYIGSDVTKVEYPVWLWKNGKEEDWPLFDEVLPYRLKIDDVYHLKWEAIYSHKSQLGLVIQDDSSGFVLTEDLLEPFRPKLEYYFLTNCRGRSTLNGNYFDRLYSLNGDPWNFKSSSYEHNKYRLALDALESEHFENGLEIGCSIGVQTHLLSGRCQKLLAVDISDKAIAEAKLNCSKNPNVSFRTLDVIKDFPIGRYDLITLCEVGYYFDIATLFNLFVAMDDNLVEGGKLLFVHWTSYVPDYPLTGDEVHTYFDEFAQTSKRYKECFAERYELFRVQVWSKSTLTIPK